MLMHQSAPDVLIFFFLIIIIPHQSIYRGYIYKFSNQLWSWFFCETELAKFSKQLLSLVSFHSMTCHHSNKILEKKTKTQIPKRYAHNPEILYLSYTNNIFGYIILEKVWGNVSNTNFVNSFIQRENEEDSMSSIVK